MLVDQRINMLTLKREKGKVNNIRSMHKVKGYMCVYSYDNK